MYKNWFEFIFQDKVVLVIRCGIGLLPLLCARDGKAKKVIALEQSACIEYARRIITDNRYSTVITLVQSNVSKMLILLFLYDLLLVFIHLTILYYIFGRAIELL